MKRYLQKKEDSNGIGARSNITNKTGYSKITEENSTNRLQSAQINICRQKKRNYFGIEYGKEKNLTETQNESITLKKSRKNSKKAQRRTHTWIRF